MKRSQILLFIKIFIFATLVQLTLELRANAEPPSKYQTTSLRKIYRGEELGQAERFKFYPKKVVASYFPESQRDMFRVYFKDGLMYDAHNDLVDTKTMASFEFDENSMSNGPIRLHPEDGMRALYVMDKNGGIYISMLHRMPEVIVFFHSSFFSGGPVAGAGRIEVEAGVVTYIDNESGHYHPSPRIFDQVIAELKTQNVVPKKIHTNQRIIAINRLTTDCINLLKTIRAN